MKKDGFKETSFKLHLRQGNLTNLQQETLRALLNCLIPPDDFPGAWDAGVSDYLTRLFESDLEPQKELYLLGIDAIESEALARFHRSFSSLASDQQISTLQAIESGHVLGRWPVDPQTFFELVVNTTAEGYYSDPQQGGNRGAISWVMTGFEEHVTS